MWTFSDFEWPVLRRRLCSGTPRQRDAVAVLDALRIFRDLAAHAPILAGTVPIDVDVADSDLDVIVQAGDMAELAGFLRDRFGHCPGFRLTADPGREPPRVVAGFAAPPFEIEIYGEPRPPREQNAVRHMIVEARLLEAEPGARSAIRALKQRGLKTEPAFAAYFGIPGDPYASLLRLYDWDAQRLRLGVESRRWSLFEE